MRKIRVWIALIAIAQAFPMPSFRHDLLAENAVFSSRDSINATALHSSRVATALSGSTGATALPKSPVATASSTTDSIKLVTPGAGSATRTAMLDAIRQRLKMSGKFRVDHIRTWGRWGFVRATEVVELDKGELQETDLTVAALLEMPVGTGTKQWRIAELWSLPDDQAHPMADFLRAIRAKQRAEKLPSSLFPDDLK